MVFEFCDHDLAGLLSNTSVKFTLSEMKMMMQQLFNGLFYIHKNNILHRDMKTANILVTKDGFLKLADFGLARALGKTNFFYFFYDFYFFFKFKTPSSTVVIQTVLLRFGIDHQSYF